MAGSEYGRLAQGSGGTASLDRVRARLVQLGLEANAADLDAQGYTIVEDAAPLELFDRIREAILRVTEETHARGVEPFNFGPRTTMMYHLLLQDDAFVEAVLQPKVGALMDYILGEGHVLSIMSGSTLSEGCDFGPLHADNQYFPEPFPELWQLGTAIWCCEDFSGEDGSTHVVPGSHLRRRHPRAGEALDEAIPMVAPRGSIVVWTGHTWHRSGARQTPGRRVALHTAFARPHLRVFESWSPDEIAELTARDPRLARLMGADLPWGFVDSPDAAKIRATALTTQATA
jgi:ectoine hydroxylase-related dioxygenase (phytanoyl-CoA dioxygenase family)